MKLYWNDKITHFLWQHYHTAFSMVEIPVWYMVNMLTLTLHHVCILLNKHSSCKDVLGYCHCMRCNKTVSGLKWSCQGNTHFIISAIHLEAVSFVIMEYALWSHHTTCSILWSLLVRIWQVQLVISLNLLPFHATLSYWKRNKSNGDNLVSRDSVCGVILILFLTHSLPAI